MGQWSNFCNLRKDNKELQDDTNEVEKLKEQINQLHGLLSPTSMVKSSKFQSCPQLSHKQWITHNGATNHMLPRSGRFQIF